MKRRHLNSTIKLPAGTLKEAYQKKLTTERILLADRFIIAEHTTRILLEKLNKEDFANVNLMIKKLRVISGAAKTANITPLVDAIKSASDEVNEFVSPMKKDKAKKASGFLTGVVSKLAGKGASENPLIKCSVLISSLEEGFEQLQIVFENNVEGFDDQKNDTKKISELMGDDEKVKKTLLATIPKAFVPGDMFSKVLSFMGSDNIPYIADSKKFAESFLDAPSGALKELIKTATQNKVSDKLQDTAEELAAASKEDSSAEEASEKSSSGQKVASVQQVAAAAVLGQTEKKNLSDEEKEKLLQQAKKSPENIMKPLIDDIAKRSGVKDSKKVEAVVNALIKAGKLKTEFNIAAVAKESLDKRSNLLSIRDVEHARMLYLESGCSSRRWVDLLCELDLNKADEEDFKTLKSYISKLGPEANLSTPKGPKNAAYQLKKTFGEKINPENEIEEFLIKNKEKLELKWGDIGPAMAQDIMDRMKNEKVRNPFLEELSNQYGIPVQELEKAFNDNKLGEVIAQIAQKKGSEGIKDAAAETGALGQKKESPIDKLKNKISSAKSLDDLITTLEKLGGDAVIKKIGDEELTVDNQVGHIKSIIKDPKKKGDLLKSIADTAGLQTKVKELLDSEEATISDKSSSEKHTKTIEAIKDSVKDVTPQEMIKIFDAIPGYFMVEALRKTKLLETRRRVNLRNRVLM